MKGLLRAIDAEISKMAIPSVDPHDLPPLLSIDSQGSLSSLIAGRSWKILEDQGLDFVLPSKVLAPPPPGNTPWIHLCSHPCRLVLGLCSQAKIATGRSEHKEAGRGMTPALVGYRVVPDNGRE